MESKFTWLPKMTRTAEQMPAEIRGAFLWAVVKYGTDGVEPTFSDPMSWALMAAFESIREDIDNYKKWVESGKKGGRGNKSKKESGVSETANTPLTDDKPPFTDTETQNEKGFEKSSPIPLHTTPYHTNPLQTITPQKGRFNKPSVGEVREYLQSKGWDDFADEFIAHYESNGWKVGRNPMNNWKAACSTWNQRRKPKGVNVDAIADYDTD